MKLDSRIPSGPIEKKWDQCKFDMKLVNPANKRKYRVIVVGTGLAGGSAAATLAELGYNVECFCFQDSPRRIHVAYRGDTQPRDSCFKLAACRGAQCRIIAYQQDRLFRVGISVVRHEFTHSSLHLFWLKSLRFPGGLCSPAPSELSP